MCFVQLEPIQLCFTFPIKNEKKETEQFIQSRYTMALKFEHVEFMRDTLQSKAKRQTYTNILNDTWVQNRFFVNENAHVSFTVAGVSYVLSEW